MVDSATEFRKNGFNDEDAAQLARISSMFQNVADETISAGDSAQFLISQLIAFNQTGGDVEANAMHIADALNQVANEFAVGTGDLATGLKVVASSSAGMGNSLEQTIGLLVSITEQTKNASKSARSVNAIMANLAQVLDEGSTNGKKITEIFEDLGLQMYDTNGQLKSGFDLLKDLSDQWGTLDGNTQKYIATTLAGTTQLNSFLALMNNFDHAVDATETALDSQGSAIQENDRYMESISAKLAQLNSTFQDFANNVVSSNVMKVLLDIANGLLKIANTPLGQVVTQITLLTAMGWGATSLVNALGIFQAASGQFYNFARMLKDVAFAASGAQGPLAGVAAEGLTLTTALSGALPVIAAVAGALVVGGILWKATEDIRKSYEDLTNEIQTSTDKIQDNKDRLAEINAMGWNEKTPEIIAEKEALEKENQELQNQIDKLDGLAKKKLTKSAKNTLAAGTISESKYGVTGITGEYAGMMSELEGKGFDTLDELIEYLSDRIPRAQAKTKQGLEELGVSFGQVRVEVDKNGQEYEEALIQKANELHSVLETTHELNDEQIKDYEEVTSKLEDVADAHNVLADGATDARDALDQLTGAYEENSNQAAFNAENTALTKEQVDELISKYPQLKTAIQQVNGVNYLNVESLKAVTGASEQEVSAMYDSIAATVAFNNTQLDLSQQVAEIYRLGEAMGVVQSELAAFKTGIGQDSQIDYILQEAALSGKSMTRKQAEETYLQSVMNRWKAKTSFSNRVNKVALGDTGGGGGGTTSSASKARSSAAKSTQKEETAEEKLAKAIKAANEAYNEQISILENRMYILEQQAPDDPLASEESLNQYKSVQEQKIAYYKQMQQKTHDLAEEYRRLGVKEESETLTDLGKKWWQYQKEIKDVYASISDYTDKFADKLKEQAEEVRQKAIEEAEKVREAEKEAINDTIDSLQRKQNAYEILFDYMSEQVDAEISKLEEEKSAVEDYWDERIQAIQDTNDATEESIELEEKLNNLAKAKAKKSYVFKDGRFQYVEDVDEISQAQSELDAYNRQKALAQEVANLEKLKKKATDSIDAQIKNWQKYKDEWSSVVKKYQAEQNKLLVEQELGIKLEGNNWKNRVNQFSDFADQYKKVMSEIEDAQKELEEILTKEIVIPDIKIPDGIYMTEEDRIALAQAGRDYNNATTDAERKAAHERAEAIRRKYGYSGGIAGDEYIPTTSDSSSSSSNRKNNTSSSSNSSSSSSSGSKLPQDLAGRANNPDKYAEGTYRARGGLSIVGEKGPELRVLNTGDGILPGNVTKNLWDWGKINPNQFTGTNVTNVNVSNVSLPNVKTAEDFVAGLRNLAIQRAYKR